MNTPINNVAVIGSSGAIGRGFVEYFSAHHPDALIHAFSRQVPSNTTRNIHYHNIDYLNEDSLQYAAEIASIDKPLDRIVLATGLLHDKELKPEKTFKSLSRESLQRLHEINTIVPALVAKHFLPTLNREKTSVFAALSARVGSISDNQLGGWYAYRTSKAALNMLIKSFALEMKMRNKQAIVVGLHPGTVDSALSKPFQGNVPEGKLFTVDYSVNKLMEVVENLNTENSGQCIAWDGQEILP
ncbi:SDR family NAD(P)-dependent oxidoreductase [Pseudoteredinibacter isoporae]|uniref:NAD(P)-dependent dehydrogenase (Short-subunit alcohol dehydrogenase family) n=1 Tax=Pseudoteredinibacter isoporae TaxID=570281 RepID=A0A7X0MTX3_9GAMM|nr:SDR family NAD(P)-dependent oxidoreductase [Pseudoteredinibacter isoporae]MBB6520006.1 NAD(P)-dependent dehydrogenase (short-subunit alcohol dehydrogenase family) [Pseudoteredinibacter isoporae]NHO85578.1 SDR family NAD(P)-dependent oxidoreductase [Pseudoteredinibacter isoporae]NIB25970.1 SDR family NAD(P)-dependent oxidoreductase [Pseudoteredinibacter isoporae]